MSIFVNILSILQTSIVYVLSDNKVFEPPFYVWHVSMVFKGIATKTFCTICTFLHCIFPLSNKKWKTVVNVSRNEGFLDSGSPGLCLIQWQCLDKWNCQSAQSSPRDDVVVDCKCGRTSGGFHPPWSQPETIRSGYWLLLILICHDSYPHKQHMASQMTRDIYTPVHGYQHPT